MNIAFLIHSLRGGGAERVTSHMAAYWSEQGHQVTVLTLASTENNRYALPANVNLQALGIDGVSHGLISGLFNNISRLKTLRKTISALQPDIVISMMATANVMAGIACKPLKTKCIGSERNYPGIDDTGRLWGTLRKYTYRFLDAVITQTPTSERWIIENTNAKHVVTISNPLLLPLPDLPPRIPPPRDTDRKLILGVGRLTAQKQFTHLIQSFAGIANDHSNWDLAIVGEGEDRQSLEDLITRHKLDHRIRLVGRAGNIADWYQAADIFALTSFTEGFPNALIEAMAHGTPSISYDCLTGPGEIISNGHNGLLVEADNMQAFSTTLDQLMRSTELQRSLAKNCVEIISTLNPDKIMKQWEIEIKKAIET